MTKDKSFKLIGTGLLVLVSILIDFVLHGLFREYPFVVFLVLWILIDRKFNLEVVVFLVASFLLLLSEVFLAVYGMSWFVDRAAMWVFFIFLFIIFSELGKLFLKKSN